jgi:hypothetical protein
MSEPCLSSWGSELPEVVCRLGGRDASTGETVGVLVLVVLFLAFITVAMHLRQRTRARMRADGQLEPLHRDRNLDRPLTARERWEDLDG